MSRDFPAAYLSNDVKDTHCGIIHDSHTGRSRSEAGKMNGIRYGGDLVSKGNCALRQWESETLKYIINYKVDEVNLPPQKGLG